jgi:hypothetical protein
MRAQSTAHRAVLGQQIGERAVPRIADSLNGDHHWWSFGSPLVFDDGQLEKNMLPKPRLRYR